MVTLNLKKGIWIDGHNFKMEEELWLKIGNLYFRCVAFSKSTDEKGSKSQLIKLKQ